MLNMMISKSIYINLIAIESEQATIIEAKVNLYNAFKERGLKHPTITDEEHLENLTFLNNYYGMLMSL